MSGVNGGYAGGMNLGWEARDGDSRYVAFLNNDIVIQPESLRRLVEHMEGSEKLAATDGLIHLGDGKRIYPAGGWMDELLLLAVFVTAYRRTNALASTRNTT